MKSFPFPRPLRAALSIALLCLGATATWPARSAERGPVPRAVPVAPIEIEARVIVKYKAGSTLMRALSASTGATPPQHAQALSARLGLTLTDGRTIGARAQVVKGWGLSSRDLAERLAAQSDVEYAVVDGRMHALALAPPNDPLYGPQTTVTPAAGQWYLRPPTGATIVDATSVVSAINAEAAWNLTTGKRRVVVAVLDTGVRMDHPDLAPKLRPGYDFITDTTVSVDGDGRDADPSDPGDYGCTAGEPSSWHGTQTAGLIGAATNNGIGMASVGRDVMLLPVRVLGKCGGYDSDIQDAMLWAVGVSASPWVNPYPAKVVNLSLGSGIACSQSYKDVVAQVNAAGAVVVAAAGNDGLAVGSPANCPGVIAVAGVRHAGTKVGYSDLGPEVAIAAPAGNCVKASGDCLFPLVTTSNIGTTVPVANTAGGSIYTGGGSDASLGTSFSAPLVAGTVGLMFSANPALTPAQALAALKSTARTFPSSGAGATVTACTAPTATAQSSECYCTTSTCGAGLLDAGAAVASVAILTANIDVASTSITTGAAVALDGSSSSTAAGRAIASYEWAITGGSGLASFTSATNASTATLQTNPTSTGTVTVSLTVTDGVGTDTTTTVLTVNTPPPAPQSSSGGGGAMQPGWLLGWLAAVIAIGIVTPRGARRRD